MEEKTALRADPVLLAKCKRIFGVELVVGAWVTTYDFGRSTPEEIDARLEAAAYTEDDGRDQLRYDGQDILIEFSSGKKVILQNSEWASIHALSLPTYLA